MHVAARLDRNVLVHDQPALESRRQVVALGESRRQMPIMIVIPAAQVAVMVGVAEMIVSASVIFVSVGVTVAMPLIPVFPAIIVAVVFVVPMAVSLGYGHCGGERSEER